MDYLRDPQAIYDRSFATIRDEADLGALSPSAHPVAIRIIHACGMTEIVADLRISADFTAAAFKALADGAPILTDSEMVRHGIIASTLPAKNRIICTLNDPAARERGVAAKTTRSAAAVSLWKDHLAGAVVAIGNAPTALLALLEGLDGGWPKPAAIAAFPVGFVGAAESKDALVAHPRGIPVATLLGRRGGSAMAAAAINALTRS